MKKRNLAVATALLLGSSLLLPRLALAHGEPTIVVEPAAVAAGESIQVTGTDMEPGEVFTVSLEGVDESLSLGTAEAAGEGDEGGFAATFTIPSDTQPGSYAIRATTEEGEAATADLTVTGVAASSGNVNTEPSAEPLQLDRTKPAGQVAGAIVIALFSGLLGMWLVFR